MYLFYGRLTIELSITQVRPKLYYRMIKKWKWYCCFSKRILC